MWFKSDRDRTTDSKACYCDFCISEWNDLRKLLHPYWVRGLKFLEGDVITLETVKKAHKIIMECLDEIPKLTSLEALCGELIQNHLEVHYQARDLPLPKFLQEKIEDGVYHDEVLSTGNFTHDEEFYHTVTKNIPGILWKHVGMMVMRTREHPWIARF